MKCHRRQWLTDATGPYAAVIQLSITRRRGGIADPSWNVTVNGEMLLFGESAKTLHRCDRVQLLPIIAGGEASAGCGRGKSALAGRRRSASTDSCDR